MESLHFEKIEHVKKIFRLKTEKTKNIRRLPSVDVLIKKVCNDYDSFLKLEYLFMERILKIE